MNGGVPNELLIIVSAALVLTIIGAKYLYRAGVPIILLFVAAGMLTGSEGIGGIEFENYHLAYLIGTFALLIILFDSGFHADAALIRKALRPSILLATLGLTGTAALTAAFLVSLVGWSWTEGLLLGTIVATTDAAAIIAILRKQKVVLRQSLRAVLELESGINDPPAIFLTVALTAMLLGQQRFDASFAESFFVQMIVGGVLGFAVAKFLGRAITRLQFDIPALYPLLVLAVSIFIFAFANFTGGSGFMAIYIFGIILGSYRGLRSKYLISRFYDDLSWLMQIVMFMTLGLLISPSRLLDVAGLGVLLGLFVLFVARPLTTVLALTGSSFSFREKILISWAGLRGAVPIILAIYPLLAGVERGHEIFNLVFFVVFLSILLQGTTVGWLAKQLHIDITEPAPEPST